jgi:hexokinase
LIPSTPKSTTGNECRASLRSSSNTHSPPILQVAIACDGSVINKYPNFREHCQTYLNQLTQDDGTFCPLSAVDFDSDFQGKEALTGVRPSTLISLDPAPDSGIFGAAVAVAIATPES